jgi:hypothetical protein
MNRPETVSANGHKPHHLLLKIANSELYTKSPQIASRKEWIHEGHQCSACKVSPIIGYRFMCTTCGISLCESCEFDGAHDVRHSRLKLAQPVNNANHQSNSNSNSVSNNDNNNNTLDNFLKSIDSKQQQQQQQASNVNLDQFDWNLPVNSNNNNTNSSTNNNNINNSNAAPRYPFPEWPSSSNQQSHNSISNNSNNSASLFVPSASDSSLFFPADPNKSFRF